MLNREYKTPWMLIVIGIAAGLAGAGLIWFNAAQKEKTIMKQEDSQRGELKTVPPIDAAAPQEFETATFAMG